MNGVVLWMISEDLPFLLAPLAQWAYIDYYGPSLSAWGTAVSILGGVVATAIAAIICLESRI